MTNIPEQRAHHRRVFQSPVSARSYEETASPHRAGHYSGLHPEDQPSQSEEIRDARRTVRRPEPVQVDDEFEEEAYEEEEDDGTDTGYDDPPRMPSSVRRYGPVQPAYPRSVVRFQYYNSAVPPRASRTQTQDYPPPAPKPSPHSEPEPRTMRPAPERRTTTPQPRRRSGPRLHWLVYVGGAMLLMMIGWMALSEFANWWQTTQDTLHYGYPRTFQVDAVVGHADSAAHPSHFIALNLHGQIRIIEFPGGDVTRAKVYIGPDLMGPGQDLTPVTLSFKDTSGNGKPEMIVTVGTAHYLYRNAGSTFVPPKPSQ
jgi:hypothetical protein